MQLTIALAQQQYHINTDFGHSLAIAVDFHHSKNQPNHFNALPALASQCKQQDLLAIPSKVAVVM